MLEPLEKMLARYPRAKVVWCHLGQVRYASRCRRYGPDYVRSLLGRFPNLHFDLASTDIVYPGSGERQCTLVDRRAGGLRADWRAVIEESPWRFHSALDLDEGKMDQLEARAAALRALLGGLSPQARAIVAYRASWKLLFGEEL